MFLNSFNYFPSNYFYHLVKLLLLLNVSTKWQTTRIKILLDFFEFFGNVTLNMSLLIKYKSQLKSIFFIKKRKSIYARVAISE